MVIPMLPFDILQHTPLAESQMEFDVLMCSRAIGTEHVQGYRGVTPQCTEPCFSLMVG
jgi:hypothetical protein